MKRRSLHILVITAAAVVILCGIPIPGHLHSAVAVGDKPLEYRDGLLNLEARQRPLLDLLKEIARASGIEIILFDPVDPVPTDVGMKDRPLDQALKAILRGYSYAVIYGSENNASGTVRFVNEPKTYGPDNSKPAAPGRRPFVPGFGGASPDAVKEQTRDHPTGPGPKPLPGPGQPGNGNQQGGSTGSPAASTVSPEQIGQISNTAGRQDAQSLKNRASREEKLKRLISLYEQRIASGVSDREYQRNVELSGGGYNVPHDQDRINQWESILQGLSKK